MVLEYSRDGLAGPLEALNTVLSDIRSGSFDPDADRSGRRGCFGGLAARLGFDTPWQPKETAEAEEPEEDLGEELGQSDFEEGLGEEPGQDGVEEDLGKELGQDSGSESGTGSSSSHGPDEIEEEPLCSIGGAVPEPALPQMALEPSDGKRKLFVHSRLGTLHAARVGDSSLDGRLFCGVEKKRATPITCVMEGTFTQVCSRCFGDDQLAE